MATSKKLKALVRAEQARSGDSYMTVLARMRRQQKGAVVTNKPTAQRLITDAQIFRKTKEIRVWRTDRGVPLPLGNLPRTASEEDFIRTFFAAMPSPGEHGAFLFVLRPIDHKGNELGVELPLIVQSDHPFLDQLRKTVVTTFFGDERPAITPALLDRAFGGEKPKRRLKADLEADLARLVAEREALQAKVRILSVTADNQDKRIRDLTHAGRPNPWADMSASEQEPAQIMLYSSVYHPRGSVLAHTNTRFFVTSLGGHDRDKNAAFDKSDTNLKEPGRAPGHASVQVRSVTAEIIGGTDEDRDWIRGNGVLAWDLTQTNLDIGPLGAFDWDASGRKGVFKLTNKDVPPDEPRLPGPHVQLSAVPRPLQAPGAPSRPSNLFKWGEFGLVIPAGVTFSMLVQYGRSKDREISETTRLRVSLACTFLTPIEIG